MLTGRDQAPQEPKRRERTALRTAVLAALLNQPGYGWDIASRLNTGMGPAWDVDPKRVYQVLEEFEEDGWAWSQQEQGPGKRGRWRRVYYPTALAERARVEWLQARQSVWLMRADIRTWIAFARHHDAPELLRKLHEYEMDCLEMLECAKELEVLPASWHDRAINLLRAASAEELAAEMRWIKRARREVTEHLVQ